MARPSDLCWASSIGRLDVGATSKEKGKRGTERLADWSSSWQPQGGDRSAATAGEGDHGRASGSLVVPGGRRELPPGSWRRGAQAPVRSDPLQAPVSISGSPRLRFHEHPHPDLVSVQDPDRHERSRVARPAARAGWYRL